MWTVDVSKVQRVAYIVYKLHIMSLHFFGLLSFLSGTDLETHDPMETFTECLEAASRGGTEAFLTPSMLCFQNTRIHFHLSVLK